MAISDHSQFQFAAERYVLGELSELEALEFENHFFSCSDCARDVRDLTDIREAIPVVLPPLLAKKPEKFFWGLYFPRLSPGLSWAAAAIVGVFAGYQNVVEIPRLVAAAEGNFRILPALQTFDAARGAGDNVFSTREREAPLVIRNEWPETYSHYRAQIQRPGGKQPLLSAETQQSKGDLAIAIPAAKLGAGEFELVIFGDKSGKSPELVARCSFTIQEKSAR